MPKFLALDTCSEACSAALVVDNQVWGEFKLVGNRHSEVILSMVQSLLAGGEIVLGQLDAIGFTRGPGSFTGVRIGTGVVQGLALGSDLPVIPVSSLALLAQGADADRGRPWLLPLLDARMGEVYWACYQWQEAGAVIPVSEENVSAVASIVCDPQLSWQALGTGAAAYAEQFPTHISELSLGSPESVYPNARHMKPLLDLAWKSGDAVAPENALPLYLRNNVAHKSKPRSQ